MPTYEYRCRGCGDHLEVHQAFTDDPLTECPTCGGELRKRFGNVGIAFKGSGFYKNDARSGSTSTGGGASSTSSSSSEPSGSSSGSKDGGTTSAPATASSTTAD
jgi:putative FmdB family regulatory protein